MPSSHQGTAWGRRYAHSRSLTHCWQTLVCGPGSSNRPPAARHGVGSRAQTGASAPCLASPTTTRPPAADHHPDSLILYTALAICRCRRHRRGMTHMPQVDVTQRLVRLLVVWVRHKVLFNHVHHAVVGRKGVGHEGVADRDGRDVVVLVEPPVLSTVSAGASCLTVRPRLLRSSPPGASLSISRENLHRGTVLSSDFMRVSQQT